MSRKHKQKQEHFYRGNHEGIKKEKAAMVLSGLRVRAGMAAVSALLILSPIVISAAGSIAHLTAQDDTGTLEPGQTGSTLWFSGEEGGTGNTAADTGSTLAAVPQDIGMFPADDEEEGIESNDASTGNTAAEGDEAAEPDEAFRENDDEEPETGATNQEEEPEEKPDDSNTSLASQGMTDKEYASEPPEMDDQKNDADNTDGAGAGKEDPNEDADSADASDDGSEDTEGGDREASSRGVTDSEAAEDSESQDLEKDKDNESSAAFISDGEDGPTGSDITTDTDIDLDTGTQTESNEEAVPEDAEGSTAEPAASGAAILISHGEKPEKTAGLSAGDTVEISMIVKNSGSELLTDVEVSEILDDDAKIAVAWDRSSDPATGENILSEGETVPFTVNYTVTQDDLDAGKLVREAEASAETTDRDEVKDEQTSEVILRSAASIDFSKEADVRKISNAKEGMSIQYYFTVTNSGNMTLRNIEVIDQMAGLSRIEYDWNGSTDSSTGEGYLSPGEKVTASARYAITSDDIRNGRIVNKAFARGETLQGTVIESGQPETPTSISQEGKEESPHISSATAPATGDFTDIYTFLTPFIISAAALTGAAVIGKIQRKKMDFAKEEKD